ncbi:MAG: UPF0182 family protein [Oscillospiraceae bacterium]|nr:UPF0182 family protein [Oscillospiraceae bacterium]
MEQDKSQLTKEQEKVIKRSRLFNKRVILVLLFLLIFVICEYINFRGNYLETLEIGGQYVDKFMQEQKDTSIIGIITFVIIYLAIYINTRVIKRGLKKFFVEEKRDMPKLPNKSLSLFVSLILAVVISSIISPKIMLFLNSTWFGQNDPIFNMDIRYYIFQKPCIEMLLQYIIVFVVGLLIYSAAYYVIVLNKYFEGIDIESLKKNTITKQLSIYIIIVAVCVGVLTFLKAQDVLFSNFMSVGSQIELAGAGSIDVIFKVWGYRILSILIIISVILALSFFKRGDKKKTIISVLIVPAYLVLLFLVIILYKIIFINPNELDMERAYIDYNIKNTKIAYNINVEENDLTNTGTLTKEEATANKDILNNIPIVDKTATLATLTEYQTNTGYYEYNNTQLLNYNNQLVYVTPREIVNNGGVSNSNKTYEYTHGYSAIISKANTTDGSGNIEYIQDGFDAKNEAIKVTEPRIYFGLSTNNAVITNSKDKQEFDYITNNNIVNNSYSGEAGLQLNFLDRLILAIKTWNFSIAFGGGVTSDSKILLNRNIRDRAKKVLPDLVYDPNPYLVITDEGRLVWVLDAYTISSEYPYSTSSSIDVDGTNTNINYIRNSVKVIVDAYDGTMQFYITDRNDPIIMAYEKMYPSIFMPADAQIPESISKYIVYPEYLYNIQSKMLMVYHNIQPDVLYRDDSEWEIASYNSSTTTTKTVEMDPYYTMVKDGNSTNTGLVVPYTIKGKTSIISYLVGTNGDKNNGKLTLFTFSEASNVLGPKQLESQITADENIKSELDSIALPGTKVSKNVLAIPIQNTILYVEPVYQTLLNENQVPILKKVIVASGNKLAIGDDFQEALNNLLSQNAIDIEVTNPEDIEALLDEIVKANSNLTASMSGNDWGVIGSNVNRLQSLINQLDVLRKDLQNQQDQTGGAGNTTNTNNTDVQNIINNITGNANNTM